MQIREGRAPGFWPLALVFGLFVAFMYGPMLVIFLLGFILDTFEIIFIVIPITAPVLLL